MGLVELLKRQEGKVLEFKRDLSGVEGVLKTIVAFANTSGGTLLIGVEDQSRHVRGVEEPVDMEERLANLISDRVSPRLIPEIEILPWRETYVLSVEVFPSPTRPHYLSGKSAANTTYVRVGSSNRRADQQLLEELRRSSRSESYDEQPMPELDSEELDFRAASEFFAGVRKLRRRDLETLHLLAPHQGRSVPTVGGVILFGKNRRQHFPDAWIQAGRFRGFDKSKIVDQAEIRSMPVRAVEEAIEFVEKHSLHGAEIGSVRRREIWSVPPVVVREAVINAVAHADYSQTGAPIRVSVFDDRLEIESPGLLPLGLTIEDLQQGVSKLRNRVIGRAFYELGLIEQWGSGVQRMIAGCQDAGLAPPRFEEVAVRFRVTIPSEKVGAPKMDDKDRFVLEQLASSEGLSTSEIANALGMSTRATRTRLAKLVASGHIREIGTGPQDPKRIYVLAE